MLALIDHLQQEASVIRGAPVSFAFACLTTLLIGLLVFQQRIKLLQGTIDAQRSRLDDYRQQLEAIAPAQGAKSIRISAPAEGAVVGNVIHVTGTTKPRSTAIQVLVRSGDGRWYPQDRPTFQGDRWMVRCWIGEEDTARGAGFGIIAVDTGEEPIREPVKDVPASMARSKIVSVQRA